MDYAEQLWRCEVDNRVYYVVATCADQALNCIRLSDDSFDLGSREVSLCPISEKGWIGIFKPTRFWIDWVLDGDMGKVDSGRVIGQDLEDCEITEASTKWE